MLSYSLGKKLWVLLLDFKQMPKQCPKFSTNNVYLQREASRGIQKLEEIFLHPLFFCTVKKIKDCPFFEKLLFFSHYDLCCYFMVAISTISAQKFITYRPFTILCADLNKLKNIDLLYFQKISFLKQNPILFLHFYGEKIQFIDNSYP